MKVLAESSLSNIKSDGVALFVYKGHKLGAGVLGKSLFSELSSLEDNGYVNYDKDSISVVPYRDGKDLKKLFIVSVSKKVDDIRDILSLGATLAGKFKSNKIKSLALLSLEDSFGESKDVNLTKAVVDGILSGSYVYEEFLSKKNKNLLSSISVVSGNAKLKKLLDAELKSAVISFEAVYMARDLVNAPSNHLTPESFVKYVKSTVPKSVKAEYLDVDDIKKEKLNLLESVGKASANPPYMIKLSYSGNKKSNSSVALVGKGVTFDTGGTNLKPTQSMSDMKSDMAGAATVYSAFCAIVKSKMKINVDCYIPLAENIIGYNASKPSDVVTAASGVNVEINNTDAEGRLILADALHMAIEKKPSLVVDVATLTGAVVVALGDQIAGFFANDEKIAARLKESSKKVGEDVWELPLYKKYKDYMKGSVTDLQNISSNKGAGSTIGALFLEEFVNNTPWIHLDIAGVAYFSSGSHRWLGKYSSGFGVRLLLDFLFNNYSVN